MELSGWWSSACANCGKKLYCGEPKGLDILRCRECNEAVWRGIDAARFCYVCGANRCVHDHPLTGAEAQAAKAEQDRVAEAYLAARVPTWTDMVARFKRAKANLS